MESGSQQAQSQCCDTYNLDTVVLETSGAAYREMGCIYPEVIVACHLDHYAVPTATAVISCL